MAINSDAAEARDPDSDEAVPTTTANDRKNLDRAVPEPCNCAWSGMDEGLPFWISFRRTHLSVYEYLEYDNSNGTLRNTSYRRLQLEPVYCVGIPVPSFSGPKKKRTMTPGLGCKSEIDRQKRAAAPPIIIATDKSGQGPRTHCDKHSIDREVLGAYTKYLHHNQEDDTGMGRNCSFGSWHSSNSMEQGNKYRILFQKPASWAIPPPRARHAQASPKGAQSNGG
ncbi:hypothetical protein B0T17DRAFT_511312 [Bombardia bombarda]|uniref:Uncharacterized protein n=1 Tax=Bombardia bombarda TaxID=252184 RepID=A0AA39U6L8_9PEZI|nr:hypothetical protein B0T17DRAFT_511312 [Bombardia bombarda]